MTDIVENIIESIARYLYFKIHVTLPSIAKENTKNQYNMYELLLVKYSDLFIPDDLNHAAEIKEIYDYHLQRDVNGVMTLDNFVGEFSDHYTFYKHVDKMSNDKKFSKMSNILNLVVLEYAQYIKTKDTYSYFEKNIEKQTQVKLKDYIKKLTRKNGTIIQYGKLSITKGTVPRKLFERLIKISEKQGVTLYGSS